MESGSEFNGFGAKAGTPRAAGATAGMPGVNRHELPADLTPRAPAAHGAATVGMGEATVRPKGLSLEEQVMERERQGAEWRTQMKAVKVAQEEGGGPAAAAASAAGGSGGGDEQQQQQQGKEKESS